MCYCPGKKKRKLKTRSRVSLSPEATHKKFTAGFLTCFRIRLPIESNSGILYSLYETYSSGYCTGVSPVSLSQLNRVAHRKRGKDSTFLF